MVEPGNFSAPINQKKISKLFLELDIVPLKRLSLRALLEIEKIDEVFICTSLSVMDKSIECKQSISLLTGEHMPDG